MGEKQEHDSIYMTPSGASIAAIFFFMPWVKACGQTASGADIGGIFWIIFIAAIAIVGAFFFYRSQNEIEKVKPVVIIGSVISILILTIKYFEARKQLGGMSGMIDVEFGVIGTVAGFAFALYGLAFIDPIKARVVLVDDASVTCQECGQSSFEGSKFCENCGKPR